MLCSLSIYLTCSTVKLAGWKKGLIAVFCILLLLAGILALVFRRRLIGFKRKRTAELSVWVSSLVLLRVKWRELHESVSMTPGGFPVWNMLIVFYIHLILGSQSAPKQNGWASRRQRSTRLPTVADIIFIHFDDWRSGEDVFFSEWDFFILTHSDPWNDGKECVEWARIRFWSVLSCSFIISSSYLKDVAGIIRFCQTSIFPSADHQSFLEL